VQQSKGMRAATKRATPEREGHETEDQHDPCEPHERERNAEYTG